ncbi:MAG: endonuclease III [Acidobacteria bacterium]|nr:endonuclease III [Acidobacteriota bacterium]
MVLLSDPRRERGETGSSEPFPISTVLAILKRESLAWRETALTQVGQSGKPFRLLIGCLLSQRTKDETTYPATERLFRLAGTPQEMLRLSRERITRAIYPVGFYRTKARYIRGICETLIREHGAKVPADLDSLLRLPGVGRKTANLVLGIGFGIPAICVDTHVHRITNRWGYVRTRSTAETETALRTKLPRRHWIPLNDLLVLFGQHVCNPVSPRCNDCRIARYCPRVGVRHHR